MRKVNYKMVNILIILSIIYVLFLMKDLWFSLFIKILTIIKPFLIAFSISYAIHPFLKWLQKRKIPKYISIIFIIILIITFIIFLVMSLIPIFTEQLLSLFNSILKFINEMGYKYNINITNIQTYLLDTFNTISLKISTYISNGAINLVNASINFVSNFIIIFASSIYFLIDMDKIRNNIYNFFIKRNKKAYKLIKDIDLETNKYFKGLFLTILIQFFEYTIVYYIVGHPNFLLLGILSSVSTIIPYFGGLIVNIIALIIASVISPKLFIITLIISIVLPSIDGYIISPKVYGKTNNVSPLLNIFAVFAGSILGGFIGILIALPLLIIIRTIYRSYKKDISKKLIKYRRFYG